VTGLSASSIFGGRGWEEAEAEAEAGALQRRGGNAESLSAKEVALERMRDELQVSKVKSL
jgi:hypothetical protein